VHVSPNTTTYRPALGKSRDSRRARANGARQGFGTTPDPDRRVARSQAPVQVSVVAEKESYPVDMTFMYQYHRQDN